MCQPWGRTAAACAPPHWRWGQQRGGGAGSAGHRRGVRHTAGGKQHGGRLAGLPPQTSGHGKLLDRQVSGLFVCLLTCSAHQQAVGGWARGEEEGRRETGQDDGCDQEGHEIKSGSRYNRIITRARLVAFWFRSGLLPLCLLGLNCKTWFTSCPLVAQAECCAGGERRLRLCNHTHFPASCPLV